MTYKEVLDYLFSIKDDKFAKFNDSLSNSDLKAIGVRTPVLDELEKKLVNDPELVLEDFKLMEYIEIDVLYFVIGLKRAKTFTKQLDFLSKNLKYASSWMITDLCNKHIDKKASYDEFVMFFLENIKKRHSYTRRYCYVLGLKFYRRIEITELFDYFKLNECYEVMMAQAWLLATIAINYPMKVQDFLMKFLSDEQLVRKTINKICDSLRIDEQTKNTFRSIREYL